MHVNQQAELADSQGVGLEFEATNKLQLKLQVHSTQADVNAHKPPQASTDT